MSQDLTEWPQIDGGHNRVNVTRDVSESLSRISQVIMAKSSGRLSDIQSLLTAAEKKVLDGTLGESLVAATRPHQDCTRRKETGPSGDPSGHPRDDP